MRLYWLLIVAIMLNACSDDKNETNRISWKKLGLDGRTITEMHLHGSSLYVGTTTGLFKRDIGAGNSDFVPLGFANKNIEALEVVDPGVIIVSIFDKSGAEPPALYKTDDDGANWAEIDSDFGGQINEPVFDLEVHPENRNVVYASGYHVVGKSVNEGAEWQPVYGHWGGFSTGVSVVEINTLDQNEIWAGGQGAIENGFLLRSENDADWETWDDLVENPTVVKEITFSDNNKDEIFVGFEGALLKTSDGGHTWQTLINSDDNRFFFGIRLKAERPNRVYAGGWLKTSEAQPLILFVSDNAGVTWTDLTFPSETYGGVLDMQIRTDDEADVIYLGLDKGGVYEVSVGF